MATQVVMPKLSPTMEEGQLARWLKKEGDQVSVGEPIAEVDATAARDRGLCVYRDKICRLRHPNRDQPSNCRPGTLRPHPGFADESGGT